MVSIKNRLQKLQKRRQELQDWIQRNPVVSLLIAGTPIILIGLRRVGMVEGLAKICAESSLVNICGKIIHIRDMKFLIQELQSLSHCDIALMDLHQIVEDGDISTHEKSRYVQMILLGIQTMPNLELQQNMILCFIELVTKLYFSNLSNFNTLIQALIDAFKKGKLSSRLFQIIVRMLANRGIPIDGILEAVE